MKKNLMVSLADAQLSVVDSDEWRVCGYATVYGNRNSYDFSIRKGAYANVLGTRPKMFFNHNTLSVPIGRWVKLEDHEYGLYVEGVLTKGVAEAADVYAALKAGTVDGFSVGVSFDPKADVKFGEDGSEELVNVRELNEISVVTYPADGKARVTQTLSVDEIDERIDAIVTLRDLEAFVREVGNLSKRQSGWLLSKAKAALASETLRDAEPKAHKELAAVFERIQRGLD